MEDNSTAPMIRLTTKSFRQEVLKRVSSRWIFVFLIVTTLLFLALSTTGSNKAIVDSLNILAATRLNKMSKDNFSPKLIEANSFDNNKEKDRLMFSRYSELYKVPILNCANIFKGVKHAVDLGIQFAQDFKKTVPLLNNDFYLNVTKNCENFKEARGFITSSLSPEEKKFPLAYSILIYKDLDMVERLLRSIYRPQNWYCIHVDQKASAEFLSAVKAVVGCFPNVFMASKRINVVWGEFSVLEPELVCMEDLFGKGDWRYFINLTGQEMPLKTNNELVKILTAYDGANDVESTVERANKERWHGIPPPKGLVPTKGSVHIVVNRDYIDYLLHNDTAQQLLRWVKNTAIPDETFFTMLNHNPKLGIPGSYTGWPETDLTRKPFLARFKNWGMHPFAYPCAGYRTRQICILSTGDLPFLANRPELFANKFHLLEDRPAVSCLEEKLFNATRDEFMGTKQFNVSYYQQLDFVINQVRKNDSSKA